MRDVDLGVAQAAGQPEGDDGNRRAVRYHLTVVGFVQLCTQPAGGGRQRVHDLGIAFAAQSQEVVVLADHLVAGTGEVQGEGRHVTAEVDDVKYHVLGQ